MLNEVKVQEIIKAKQVKKQKGASMIEYAILVGVIVAIGVAVTNANIGADISTKIKSAVSGATVTPTTGG
ncbi:Flp family type IVb pilin [Thiomicrorhabdus aquaedulcis]|uniref:Flp family type IVb pilin n=1 Tax=Thiomicrorhabdus aquaedulcis TaxID=2211106 RepID=UPI000FDB05D3|nr:Flp family type IVb pilin [Thiomicrorhabdus aquaedulcis]